MRDEGATEARWTAEDAYVRFAAPVLGYLRGRGVREPEDALGDVFVTVARSVHEVRGDDRALRRWVFTIARNRALDDARRQRRVRSVPAAVPEEVDGAGVAAEDDDPLGPLDPVLLDALATLTAEQREVVALRFVADLPLEDVAELTGRPVGAVKSMQHRALARLARALATGVGSEER